MVNNRPNSRERNSSGKSTSVSKRGSGLGGSSRGNTSYSSRPSFSNDSSSNSSYRSTGGYRSGYRGRGGFGITSIVIIFFVVVIYFIFSGSSSLFGSDDSYTQDYSTNGNSSYTDFNTSTNVNNGNYIDASYTQLDTTVDAAARNKFTTLVGNGNDEVTIMVYMCGTDLESNYGMATSDINEMLYSKIDSDKVNVIIETGGAKKWQNTVISNSTNQLYKVTNGGLQVLDKNLGKQSMVDPNTLTNFITYCASNYPADRYMLILWDHGGGSVTGYGYDQQFPNDGSMSIDEISSALNKAKVKFDVIGFDACLMATLETATAVEPYADYLIASEEVEPGTGWYYTDWLTKLSDNTSMPTTELGKYIIDDFISASRKNSAKDQTTLSLIDLAEFSGTVPSTLATFAKTLGDTIQSDNYATVANARGSSREFAASSHIDQIDIVSFVSQLNTNEAKAFEEAVKNCVKYNKTNNMTNAYGMSIYFPYTSLTSMNKMVKIYDNIDMDETYSNAVKSFATMVSSGQIVANNNGSSATSLIGTLMGNYSSGTSLSSNDILSLLTSSLTGSSSGSTMSSFADLLGGSSDWINTDSLSLISNLIGKNQVDTNQLVLSEKNGQTVLSMSEDQWSKIQTVELNVFIDDGEGYIDLGLDNIFSFNDDGDLIIDYDRQWMALNDHVVAYYLTSNDDNGDSYVINGYIPAVLNGQEVKILVQFTSDDPNGTVLGAQIVYADETDAEAKGLIEINDGDTIDFICDYYNYDGSYYDSFYLGDKLTVQGGLQLSDINIENNDYVYSYRLVDIYDNAYWTEAIKSN